MHAPSSRGPWTPKRVHLPGGDRVRAKTTGVAALLLALTSLACSASGLAEMSAEPTACPAERITISDAHQPWEGPSSWTAICASDAGDGQKWFCSKTHDRVICTEDPS